MEKRDGHAFFWSETRYHQLMIATEGLATQRMKSYPEDRWPAGAGGGQVSTLHRLRGFLLAIFSLGCLGTGTELFLVEHTEDAWQWAPLVLAAAGLLLAGWNTVRAGRVSGRAFQALMLLFLASAGAGLWLHYEANVEFELEIYPDLSGWALFLKAIRGTAPPSLAPMAMAVLGLLGLCWSYRHPVLYPEPSTTTQPPEPLR